MIREARVSDSKEIKDICTNDLGYQCDEQLIELRIANLEENRECVFVADIDGEIAGFVHVEKYNPLYYQSMANILGLAVLSKGLRVYLRNSLYALIIFPKKLKFGKIIALAKKYQKIFKSMKFCISCVILRYYCKKRAKNKKTF